MIINNTNLVLHERPSLTGHNKDIIYHPDIYPEDKIRLKSYIDDILCSENNSIEINYVKNKYNNNFYGRYYPRYDGLSLTYQWNKIRSTLCSENEIDIDIVNCHPVLLAGLYMNYIDCANNNDIKNLLFYIKNRDNIIDNFYIDEDFIKRYNINHKDNKVKKDFIKSLYTIILYGGNLNTWCNQFSLGKKDYILPESFNEFVDEMKRIKKNILKCPRFKNIIHDISIHNGFKKKQKSLERTYISLILQDYESEMIRDALQYIRDNTSYIITCYIYDGFQVIKNDEENINEVLLNLNKYISKKYNINITFISKAFRPGLDLSVFDELDNDSLMFDKCMLNFIEHQHDTNYSEIIKLDLKNIYVCNNTYYIYKNGYWSKTSFEYIQGNCLNTIFNKIIKYCKSNIYIYKYDRFYNKIEDKKAKDCLITKISNFVGSYNHTVYALKFALSTKCLNEKINFDNNTHLLNGPNYTLNLDVMKLFDHNKDDHITKYINVNFPVHIFENKDLIINSNNNPRDYLLNLFPDDRDLELWNLLYSWFNPNNNKYSSLDIDKLIEYFLLVLSASLDGKTYVKKAVILSGSLSRNGKSSLISLIKKCFGNYVSNLNLSYFTNNNDNPNAPNPLLITCKGCRFIEVSEVDNNDYNKISNDTFKRWTGIDEHKCRDLFDKSDNMITFNPQGTLLMTTNSNLSFKKEENAISNRLTYFNFPNMFGDSSMSAWNSNNANHKLLDINLRPKIESGYFNNSLLKFLIIIRIKFNNDINNFIRPALIIENQNNNLADVDTVLAWSNKYLIIDHSKISSNNDYDKNVIEKYNNLENQDRIITINYLYKLYCNDIGSDAICFKLFKNRITNIYSNLFNAKRTTRFSGSSNIREFYISNVRYNYNINN